MATVHRDAPCVSCGGHEFYEKTGRCAPCQRQRVGRTGVSAQKLPEGVIEAHAQAKSAPELDALLSRARAALVARLGDDAPEPLRGSPKLMADRSLRFSFLCHYADLDRVSPPPVDPLTLPGVVVRAAPRMPDARLADLAAMAEGLLRVRFEVAGELPPCAWKRKKAAAVHVEGTLMAEYYAADEDAAALWDWANTAAWPARTEPMRPGGAIVYEGPMSTPGPEVL